MTDVDSRVSDDAEMRELAAAGKSIALQVKAAHSRISDKHYALQVEELRVQILTMLEPLTPEGISAAVRSIGREFGFDPNPLIAALEEESPTIVYQRKKPGFLLDNLDQCYQDACTAAGGEWVDTAAIRGCKARDGLTRAEKAAQLAAYLANSIECLGRAGGGLLGKIWNTITG